MTDEPVGLATEPVSFVRLVRERDYEAWCERAERGQVRWLEGTGFKGTAGQFSLLPGPDNSVTAAIYVVGDKPTSWDAADIVSRLHGGDWWVDDPDNLLPRGELLFGWMLASYRFDRYKKSERQAPRLAVPEAPIDPVGALELARAINAGRDLVNTPTSDLGPAELAEAVRAMAKDFGATVDVIEGDALLERNYPMIHAVGRAGAQAPRLIDLRYGPEDAPKVTLVGKGVCFDTGGLDIKPANAMMLMKKDMGGAAAMIALAQALISVGPKIRLRLLVPAVENSISAASFRPGDVLHSRKGLTVEIGNTDAEGRLVLADALTEACSEKPDLLIDAATLTGAARVALGAELPVLYASRDATAASILEAGDRVDDPLWRLPLHQPYRKLIKSQIADLNNAGTKPFAGSITAALFLQSFVDNEIDWVHLDIFGWNDEARPGRPRGGEATAVRPLFEMISKRYGERL